MCLLLCPLPRLCRLQRLRLPAFPGHGLRATRPRNGNLRHPRLLYRLLQGIRRAGRQHWLVGPCWPARPWWSEASPGGGPLRAGVPLAPPLPWLLRRLPLLRLLPPWSRWRLCRPRWPLQPKCRLRPPRLLRRHRHLCQRHLPPFWPAGGPLPLRRPRASSVNPSPALLRRGWPKSVPLSMRRPRRPRPLPPRRLRWRLHPLACVPTLRPSTGRPVSSGNARNPPTASMPPVWLCACSSMSCTAEPSAGACLRVKP